MLSESRWTENQNHPSETISKKQSRGSSNTDTKNKKNLKIPKSISKPVAQ